MTKTTFAEILKLRKPALHNCLEEIRKRAFEEWIHLLQPDKGSHAGYVHLRNVEQNADKMIPDKSKEEFSDGEIFLLLAAILMHDLGRIIPDSGKAQCPLEGGECLDGVRCESEQGTHACRTRHLIDRLWAVFGLPDEHIARYCGLVAFWHQLDRPPSKETGCTRAAKTENWFCEVSLEPYGHLRLPLLGAILRIADETENCWTRALRQHWYAEFTNSGLSKDKIPKAFRRGIEDVEFCRDGRCVLMHVPHSEATDDVLARLGRSWGKTQAVLSSWGPHLAAADIGYERVFVEKDGRLHREPTLAGGEAPPLAYVFEGPGAGGDGEYLEPGSTARYLLAILRLVRGTMAYEKYRWSAVEGAIGEPLTPKKKWVIERIGRADEGLRIVPHPASDSVEIKFQPERRVDIERAVSGDGGEHD